MDDGAAVAVVGLAPIIAVTFPTTSTASAASPPVARDDVRRTDAGQSGERVHGRQRLRSRRRHVQCCQRRHPGARNSRRRSGPGSTTHPTPGSPASRPSPTPFRTRLVMTADAVVTVWVDTGVTGPQTPVPSIDYTCTSTKVRRWPLTTTELLSNDHDPQGQTLTVVSVSEPGNDGVLTGDLATGFTYTPSNDPAFINTDHHTRLPRHRHRRPRRPSQHHHPHPRQRRPQPTTRRS